MRGLKGHGIQYSADRARLELLDQHGDEHVWISIAVHRVQPETLRRSTAGEQVHLDMETLATVTTCCYICEQTYSDRLSYRKCTGEPND